jgi:hypothetical protein
MRRGCSQQTSCWLLAATLFFWTHSGARSVDPTPQQSIERRLHHGAVVFTIGSSTTDPINNSNPDSAFCGTCHMRRIGNLLANPELTVTALALAKLWGAHCIDHQGMNVCYGVKGPLAKLMPKEGLAVGGTIAFKPDKAEIGPTFLAHEVSHGSQWALLGSWFLPAYAGGAVYQGAGRGCNPLESSANHGYRHGC